MNGGEGAFASKSSLKVVRTMKILTNIVENILNKKSKGFKNIDFKNSTFFQINTKDLTI